MYRKGLGRKQNEQCMRIAKKSLGVIILLFGILETHYEHLIMSINHRCINYLSTWLITYKLSSHDTLLASLLTYINICVFTLFCIYYELDHSRIYM